MSEVKLDEVVEALRSAGVKSYVEQTGGGTATLMVGEPAGDEDRYDVLVGPGWFNGLGWTDGIVDTLDCYIGPDDEGQSDYTTTEEGWTVADIVAEVLRQLRRES